MSIKTQRHLKVIGRLRVYALFDLLELFGLVDVAEHIPTPEIKLFVTKYCPQK